MCKKNFQKQLDELIKKLQEKSDVPSLLLHSCCAPCSSYVLEYLSKYFYITVYFYNPNIQPYDEYQKRYEAQKKLISSMDFKYPVYLIEGKYEVNKFMKISKGLELLPEGNERCINCYILRLSESAIVADKFSFDFFTTTLTISPYKDSQIINTIGKNIAAKYNSNFLYSDFKKRDGYKKSIMLSKRYDLYRQNYCGCIPFI